MAPAPARAAARTPADRVAQLLLQRIDWWHELGPGQHDALIALPGWHAELFRWIDRWLAEHGPAAWTELRDPVAAEPWGAQAVALLDGDALPLDPELEALRTAVAQALRALATRDAMQLLGRA
jgi:DNA primase